MGGMTPKNESWRAQPRETTGEFGEHYRPVAEATLVEVPTYDRPVDELNAGDTILIDGKKLTVHETWVLNIEPETRIAATDDGDIRLSRDERVLIVRTGDEPAPEDADGFAGYCHRCGEAFARDHNEVTFHIHPRGGVDYDADENHTAYELEDWATGEQTASDHDPYPLTQPGIEES